MSYVENYLHRPKRVKIDNAMTKTHSMKFEGILIDQNDHRHGKNKFHNTFSMNQIKRSLIYLQALQTSSALLGL